ncbi:MAG: glycosyltransferase family 2 protein [Candidatus Levyibacteriota bacterium]
MNKISAVITCFNEEKKIKDCLESVLWADEIILVDNSSKDKTVEIVKKYTKNIFNQENDPGAIDILKNFGFSKASSEWILSLDADERVTPELRKEIESTINNQQSAINGYWIPRKNIIFGKWIEHTGWYPDFQLRLFRKGRGKFIKKHFHEMLELNGKTENLNSNLLHYNYESVLQFLNRHANIYAQNEVENILEKGYIFNYLDAIRFPFNEFLSRFFKREGYKDGIHGLVLSLLMAFYHLIIFSLIWEKEKFKELEKENILKATENEFRKECKDIGFWFLNEKIKQTGNLFSKFRLKVKRKFF